MGPELGEVVAQGSGYALASAASAAMILMVGFLVLARSPSSMVNRSFMGVIIACCLWMGGRAGTFGSLTGDEAADWYLLSLTGLVFLAPAIYLFATSATASTHRRLKIIVLMLTFSGGFCLFGYIRPEAVARVVPNPYTGWYPRYSLGGYLFVGYICLVTAVSCATLLRSAIPSSATQRRQRSRIRLILIGLAAGFTGVLDALPAVGVDYPPSSHFSLLVGIALIGYAVGRYQVVILTPGTTGEATAGTMQEGLFFLDLEGRILFTNRALNSLLGYREGDLEGRSFEVILAPETPLELDLGPRGRGLTGVQKVMIRTRAGGSIPATVTVNPHFDEEGETAGFVGLAQERVEEVHLGKRIRDLEGEIEGVLGTSMFGVYMVWERQIQFVNPRMAEMTGYGIDELLGMDLERIVHPDDRDLVLARVAMREQGENPENHYVLKGVKKNGETAEFEVFSMVLEREGRHIILGFARDVTNERRAEQEIRRIDEFNEWMLRNAAVGVLMLDHQGRVDYVNQRAADLLGEPAADGLRGRHVRDTALGIDSRLTGFFDEDRASDGLGDRRIENLNIRLSTGAPLRISLARIPSMMPAGEAYFLVLDDPQAKGPGRASSSVGTTREWMSLLMGGVARDVEGLLGGILGYASLARSLIPGEEKVSGYIDAITQSAHKTLEVIGQFCDTSVGPTRRDCRISLNDIVEEALTRLEERMPPSIEIQRSMTRNLPEILGDPDQLREMFCQLGQNALDSMPGGGRLKVETDEIHLDGYEQGRQEGPRAGDYVCATFEDTGPGIPEEIQEKIFGPFFVAEPRTGKAGLGLWLARTIATSHRGSILVESCPGEGSIFRVYLPVSAAAIGPGEEQVEAHPEGEGRVLIVDDEPAVREVGSELLEELGYEVLTAPDGEAALRVFDENPGVEVVILDMVMPKLNGEETFKALREKDPSVRVVISSGYTEDEKVRGLLENGAIAFVQKPYRAQTLADAVEEAMAVGKR